MAVSVYLAKTSLQTVSWFCFTKQISNTVSHLAQTANAHLLGVIFTICGPYLVCVWTQVLAMCERKSIPSDVCHNNTGKIQDINL